MRDNKNALLWKTFIFISSFLGFSLVFTSCTPLWGNQTLPTLAVLPSPIVDTSTPFIPEGYSKTPESIKTNTPSDPTPTITTPVTPQIPVVWFSAATPETLREMILSEGVVITEDYISAGTHVNVQAETNSVDAEDVTTWFYALVSPFPTIIDEVSLTDIQNAWMGKSSGPFAGKPILLESTTFSAFSIIWGDPAPGLVEVVPAGLLLDQAWAAQPAWAIIPFEKIEPRWKVLSVNGQSPIHNDFIPEDYPLQVTFGITPPVFSLPPSNRDPDKLTVLAMTGVTALVRGTADKMENLGILYPGEEVRDVLRAADITHISNEIAFRVGCPIPDPWTESLQFCSDPSYISLLEDVGTDVVELTGNHLMDYSASDVFFTLEMYDERGWKYFGGGRNLQAALQPVFVENHGNKLAFIGCNLVGPRKDWATETQPGSAPCDYEQLQSSIALLRENGFLPIMTFQYEELYTPYPSYREKIDFHAMADSGAIIVSGSQSHVPAAMEFYDGSFIHYGLGNLFFDQMSHIMPDGSLIYDTRNLFIDRHVFYDGRYLGVELLTYQIENYARPRPMTNMERYQFLSDIFNAAGW